MGGEATQSIRPLNSSSRTNSIGRIFIPMSLAARTPTANDIALLPVYAT